MKKYISYSLILVLFVISLIYSNNAVNFSKSKDPIMKEILYNKDNLKVESVNGVVDGNTITPGINGCEIDINKSYENMKKINKYNKSLIKYKDIIPDVRLTNNYSKYITGGNAKNRNVAIIYYIKDDINTISKLSNYKVNLFLDSNILKDGALSIPENFTVYNGGVSLKYDDITIEWINDLIIDNYNKPSYCLNNNYDDDYLEVCAKHKMYTITPSIIANNSYDVKKSVKNGSIIYFDEETISNYSEITRFLNSKGYNIVYLNELLDEKSCNKLY